MILKRISWMLVGLCMLGTCGVSFGQVPVTAATDHAALLKSADPHLAANKKLVYDLWRVLLEAGQAEKADQYLAPDYIQHSPNIPTGRKAFIDGLSKWVKPQPVSPTIKRPLVSIVAEGDLVILSWLEEAPDPTKPGAKYTTTSFDMFRVKDGKAVEHWDIIPKMITPPHPQ
jgi:predicted SnoaL-like aldol condensation-catalyzing enzyme